MTVAISNGIVFLLLFLQNTCAQQGVNNNVVNNAVSQTKPTYNTAGVNFNPAQQAQQINWHQPSNMQLTPAPQQPQSGMISQVKQQSPLSDIFSALQSLRFSSQKPGVSPTPSSCFQQTFDQPTSSQIQPSPALSNQQTPQYANQIAESSKPTFTFQFVPVSPQNVASEYQVQNAVPVQYLTNGQSQMASQTGSGYYMQNQPTNSMASQQVQTTQSFQTSPGQNQPMVYTLQPAQPSRFSNQQRAPQSVQPNIASDSTMASLMSQLQSPSANLDLTSILPMLMNSKQEKSGGMKALLPLILSLLTDKGCGCPHCGCPYNKAEPIINGGYSNQVNYSQQGLTDDFAKIPDLSQSFIKNIEKPSNVEVIQPPKRYKTNVINDVSEEASDEDEEYEYDDD